MRSSIDTTRLAWEDRWNEPKLADLISAINEPHRPYFEQLLKHVEGFDQAQRSLDWFGDAWKWTIEYVINDPRTGADVTLCYLVPRDERPLVCIPLTDPLIRKLPMRRLGKIVRDGIKSAKCAVDTYWAVWSPSNRTEVEQLIDLIKRKHKLTLSPKPEDN